MPLTTSKQSSLKTDFWRCPQCGQSLHPREAAALACSGCGRTYAIRDEILIVDPDTTANNAVARDFYDSPLWPKFRLMEWLTFALNGGERRSRNKILRHLPTTPGLSLLDVAVGDGVYLDWLPPDWSVTGVDISRTQLDACIRRNAKTSRGLTLVMGEAENLPFQDHLFDVALSIGGFNYFNDPEKSLREMVRTVKPGSTIVVADEVPDLTDRMFFRKIGLPRVDHFIVSKLMQLGDPFTDMVERLRELDIKAIGEKVLEDCHYELVWRDVGYVMVGRAPA